MAVGIGCVQRPGELAPRPPDEPEYDDAADQAQWIEVVRGLMGKLCNSEDEHDIEKQLDEVGALILGRGKDRTGHGARLATSRLAAPDSRDLL